MTKTEVTAMLRNAAGAVIKHRPAYAARVQAALDAQLRLVRGMDDATFARIPFDPTDPMPALRAVFRAINEAALAREGMLYA